MAPFGSVWTDKITVRWKGDAIYFGAKGMMTPDQAFALIDAALHELNNTLTGSGIGFFLWAGVGDNNHCVLYTNMDQHKLADNLTTMVQDTIRTGVGQPVEGLEH